MWDWIFFHFHVFTFRHHTAFIAVSRSSQSLLMLIPLGKFVSREKKMPRSCPMNDERTANALFLHLNIPSSFLPAFITLFFLLLQFLLSLKHIDLLQFFYHMHLPFARSLRSFFNYIYSTPLCTMRWVLRHQSKNAPIHKLRVLRNSSRLDVKDYRNKKKNAGELVVVGD